MLQRHFVTFSESSDVTKIQGSHHFFVPLTIPNINRFSKLFYSQNQEKICNNTITKDPTASKVCCYTTLWKVKCLKSNSFCTPTYAFCTPTCTYSSACPYIVTSWLMSLAFDQCFFSKVLFVYKEFCERVGRITSVVVLFSIVAFKTLDISQGWHTWGVMGSLVIVLLHIFSWFWQWNNFGNRLIFGKVKAFKKWCQFLGPHCIYDMREINVRCRGSLV